MQTRIWWTLIYTVSLSAVTVRSIQVTNSVVGVPVVDCQQEYLSILVHTERHFTGNIFVKGKSDDSKCSNNFAKTANDDSRFIVHLGHCGMRRLRSANPRGMSFVITVVVSFHPIFITKPDKAYHIRCFYTEPEEVVTANFQVSMLATTPLSNVMTMPTCSYSVRVGSPNGVPVKYARVGDEIYHVWECSGNEMGMMVKACSVSDGQGTEHNVVDYNGCTTDYSLLEQLTYERSLLKAYAKSTAFKYADRNTLYFTCQIKLCQKMLNMCEGISPPKCKHGIHLNTSLSNRINSVQFNEDPDNRKTRKERAVLTGARQQLGSLTELEETQTVDPDESSYLRQLEMDISSEIDVSTGDLMIMDIDTPDNESRRMEALADDAWSTSSRGYGEGRTLRKAFCMSPLGLTGMLISFLVTIIVCSCTSIMCYRIREQTPISKMFGEERSKQSIYKPTREPVSEISISNSINPAVFEV